MGTGVEAAADRAAGRALPLMSRCFCFLDAGRRAIRSTTGRVALSLAVMVGPHRTADMLAWAPRSRACMTTLMLLPSPDLPFEGLRAPASVDITKHFLGDTLAPMLVSKRWTWAPAPCSLATWCSPTAMSIESSAKALGMAWREDAIRTMGTVRRASQVTRRGQPCGMEVRLVSS